METNIVELAISYRCQNRCNNCGTLSTQAPVDGALTTDDIKNFVDETVSCNHKWSCITITGGEPTLHPGFLDICEILTAYRKKFNQDTILKFETNGNGIITEKMILEAHKIGFTVGLSFKKDNAINIHGECIPYVPVNNSPTDNSAQYVLGCNISKDCGVCRNYLGWFECTPAGAQARVFNYKPLAKTLADFLNLKDDEIYKAFFLHCRHCGHSWEQPRSCEQITSKTWQEALDSYAIRHKSL